MRILGTRVYNQVHNTYVCMVIIYKYINPMYFQGVCVRQVCTFQRDRDVSEYVFGDLVTVLAAW